MPSLCCSTQVSYEEFGETKTFDLMVDGENIPVTAANKAEYVSLYVKYLLEDSIKRQFDAFQRGFHSVCGGECLQLFRCELKAPIYHDDLVSHEADT